MGNRILIIDDMKQFDMDGLRVQYARTASEAKLFLETNDYDIVLFDNDLGPNQLEGYDLLKWSLQFGLLNRALVGVISNNIVAKSNMDGAMQGYRMEPKIFLGDLIPEVDSSLQQVTLWGWE